MSETGGTPTLGFLFDVRNPLPWRRPWPTVIGESLDLITEVERLGAGSVWATEHHGFDDGYLSQPLTFLAAAAARTERVRLGTGVLLAALRHPRHISEQATLVDNLSNGRLELGIGAGYAVDEFEMFDKDRSRRMTLADAAVRRLADDLWRPGLLPPPVQDRIPLWMGYQGPQGARRAGRLGVGLLTTAPDLLEPYLTGLREGGHDPATAAMGGLVPMILAVDPERTADKLAPHWWHQSQTYARAHGAAPVASPPHTELVAQLLDPAHRGLRVVTPRTAARELGSLSAGAPIRHLYFWASVAGMPSDVVAEHIGLVLTDLASELPGCVRPSDTVVGW